LKPFDFEHVCVATRQRRGGRGRCLLLLALTLLLAGCRDPAGRLHDLGADVQEDQGGTTVTCQRTKNTNLILQRLPDLPHVRALVLNDTDVTDAGLQGLGELAGLESVTIGVGRQISNAGLAHLNRLQSLKELTLVGTHVTDEGLKEVAGLSGLRQLCVSNVSELGLRHLRHMPHLEHLQLRHAKVTPTGVQELQALRGLKSLTLVRCRISEADADELPRGLPNCRTTITRDQAE
jgi:hypothetical protein